MKGSKRKKARRKSHQRQRTFGYSRTARPGKKLGRKRGEDSGVSHGARPKLKKGDPVHITQKLCEGLPTLRTLCVLRELSRIFRTVNRRGWLRVVDYSIQSNHLHMICEVRGGRMSTEQTVALSLEETLSLEMQGIKVSIARRLNRLWGRKGTVFADRYHREDLTSPRQVRNAIRYVLQNIFRHSSGETGPGTGQPDPFSSGAWFTGWKQPWLGASSGALIDAPVCEPETWLLSVGWKRHGLISITERPAGA